MENQNADCNGQSIVESILHIESGAYAEDADYTRGPEYFSQLQEANVHIVKRICEDDSGECE
jgi:hypothetical protein